MTTDPIPMGHSARPAAGPRRDDDRRITLVAVVLAAGFVALAAGVVVWQALGPRAAAPWLPLHLVLAGGATTAIAGVMPFFVAALCGGRPAGPRVRASSVVLVVVGALLVSTRAIVPATGWLPAVGGLLFLAGLGAMALAMRAAGRAGLLVRRPIVRIGYGLALANVAIGASIGTLAAAGVLPVLERWTTLRTAHAWANVVGFVSVIVIATLVHFLPTVLGTRIVPRRTAVLAVLAPAIGVPVVVIALVLGLPIVAAGVAWVVVVGAVALVVEAVATVRTRGRWTTDPGWHLVAEVGLLSGVGWYLLGVTLASLQLGAFALGLTPAGWSTPLVGAPLVVGWVLQVLVASWTQLVPSIGPGDQAAHARQRAILGRVAIPRLGALNAGTALLVLAWPTGSAMLATIGIVLVASTALASVLLLVRATWSAR